MATKPTDQLTAAASKNSQYEATIIDFVHKEQGCFIVLSDDQAFTSALRNVLQKHISMGSAPLTITADRAQILKLLNNAHTALQKPLLLIERTLGGQDMTLMVKELKISFPSLLLIVLTVDVEKHRIMYLHELGADNFIAKPVSVQTIIEKLAFTIKPQSQLGVLIDSAKEYLEENRPERARFVATEILDMKPGSAAGLMILGDAELALGNVDAARQAYMEASDSASLYLEPLRKLANLAEKTGDMEDCLKYLEQLDRLSPLNSERKVNMGEINLDLGRDEKAEKLFEAALAQAAKDAMDQIGALAERVASICADKKPEMAERFLRKALAVKQKQLGPSDIRIFNQLGISLRQQGKWREAIEEYKLALTVVPSDAGLYFNMGMAFAEGELLHDARKHMEKAMDLNENLPRTSAAVAYNMGAVLLKSGSREKAAACLNIALEINPNLKQAKTLLASLPK